MNPSLLRTGAVLVVLLSLASGCGNSAGVKEIRETRKLEQAPPSPPPNLSSAERFGIRTAVTPPSDSALPFTWSVPEGWMEAPSSQMRLVNLVPGGDPRAECYLTVLPGAGGGVEANVNRWRAQMSLEPYTNEELAGLQSKPVLGTAATYVEFEGTYVGMAGDESRPNYKLVGLILPLNEGGLFIKMLGPKDFIDNELEHFDQFRDSLRLLSEGAGADNAVSSQAVMERGELNLQWTVPQGWRKSPDRPMRAVTFTMGAENAAECYVSVFPGDAGGLDVNINRWAGQMGAGPLDAAAITALPAVIILGDDAPMVEFAGTFTDAMTGNSIENAVLLGVVAKHGDNSIFIKLVGPASEVTAQKQTFIAFCQSLHH